MDRIHLFEFEDYRWFPNTLRKCMTRYIVAIHKILDTRKSLGELLEKALNKTKSTTIIDLCSGSGGPMPEIFNDLKSKPEHKDLKLRLTDLYPNLDAANEFNNPEKGIVYAAKPVNAIDMAHELEGLRTMVCSMHHMKPEVARKILTSAKNDRQPILIYEISDNSIPQVLAWLAFPFNIIMVLFITPLVRPMSWQQLLFTYIIPILPLLIAWDGAVSNLRTYTLKDLEELIDGLTDTSYSWEKGIIPGKGGKKIYLMGIPAKR